MREQIKNTNRLVLLMLCIISSQLLFSQYPPFRVQGNWRLDVGATDITEAGDDFPNTFTSPANESNADIRIDPISTLIPWRVDVRGDEILWDSQLEIHTRRSSDGIPWTPGATITGGTTFQQLTNTDQFFFEGTGSMRNIFLQHQFMGVSVVIPAANYRMQLVLTLIEL